MSFYLTFTIGLCVGCCYGDEFLTIVSEQPVLACRSTEDLGQWKYNKAVPTYWGRFCCVFLVAYILSQGRSTEEVILPLEAVMATFKYFHQHKEV